MGVEIPSLETRVSVVLCRVLGLKHEVESQAV